MKFDDFDRLMRRFENSLDERVLNEGWIVLRLDGRGFTKLTKDELDYVRPFDDRFHRAMQNTCLHLMESGPNIALCYTQSDEISLLLQGRHVPFNGKTRKMNSVFAGEASACFSLEIGRTAAFDCRVIPLPGIENVVDYFRWRCEDARRNALMAYCYWGLRATGISPNDADTKLHGMSEQEKKDLLRKLGIDFQAQEDWKRLGSFLSWARFAHEGRDPRSGEIVPTTRKKPQWLDQTPEGREIADFVREVCALENS